MLTAKGDPVDRIIGLESGADDYLAKPFTPRELVARIQAQIRRREMNESKSRQDPQTLRFGPFELDLAAGNYAAMACQCRCPRSNFWC